MAEAHKFDPDGDLFAAVSEESRQRPLACVLVDEAQFLSREQVLQLARLADDVGIPVLCYGLRTDFSAQLFPGSAALLGLPDALVELKAVRSAEHTSELRSLLRRSYAVCHFKYQKHAYIGNSHTHT